MGTEKALLRAGRFLRNQPVGKMLGMALAALAALAAAVGGAATSVTLCGEGFHTDAQASAKSCAAAVGEHVRGDYLRNLGGMSQKEYQLACCAENKCAPWAETFGTARSNTRELAIIGFSPSRLWARRLPLAVALPPPTPAAAQARSMRRTMTARALPRKSIVRTRRLDRICCCRRCCYHCAALLPASRQQLTPRYRASLSQQYRLRRC